MEQRESSLFIERAARVNVALLALLATTLGIPGMLSTVIGYWWISLAALLLLHGLLTLLVWKLYSTPEAIVGPSIVIHDLKKVRSERRFATEADFPGADRVYNARFDPQVSMNDADFRQLMARGNLVRVIEEDFVAGSEHTTRISGYYALFPLKAREFARLVNGEVKEENLRPEDIPDLDDPEVTVIYLSEVCAYRDSESATTLMRDMLKYIEHILLTRTNITTIAAWPWTDDGKRWVRYLELKPCRHQWRGRKIYSLDRRLALASPHIPSGKFKERVVTRY